MSQTNANGHSSSFNSRLEDQLSALSNSLIRPSSTYTAQQQSQDTSLQNGAGSSTSYGGSLHSFSSEHASAQKKHTQQTLGTNIHQEPHSSKLPDMAEAPPSQSSNYNGDLLQSKRAAAMASLQKRASNSPSTGQITHSTTTESDQGKSTASRLAMTSKSVSVSGNGSVPVKTEKSTGSGPVASSADVDGLLAEVRGATDAKVRKQNAHYEDDAQSEHSRSGPISSFRNASTHEKYAGGSKYSDTDGVSSINDTSRSFPYRHEERGSVYRREQKPTHSTQGYPERRIYEPPGRSSTTDTSATRVPMQQDINSRGHSNTQDQRPYQSSSMRDYDNEFAHMHSEELEELREWLAFTNYYDKTHRQKALHRQRRLAAIEREKEELMREELDERDAYNNRSNMPPPPLGRGSASTETRLSSARRYTDDLSANYGTHSIGSPALKRHYNDSVSETHDPRADKLVRTNSDYGHESARDSDGEYMNNARRRLLQRTPSRDDLIMEDNGHNNSWGQSSRQRVPGIGEDYDDIVESHDYGQRGSWRGQGRGGRGRGRGRGRGAYSRDPEHGRVANSSYAVGYRGSIKLGVENVRYFLVKSISYENVEESQRDGTWVTQLKNIETLAEAYETCRHVILAFSVNQSKAFQGYARMDSAFGEKGIATPSWAASLNWETSPPFRVKWLNKNETRFRYVGHLNNAFNENNTVLFGRDGQEIEPNCGMELCRLLDNPADAPGDRLGYE